MKVLSVTVLGKKYTDGSGIGTISKKWGVLASTGTFCTSLASASFADVMILLKITSG